MPTLRPDDSEPALTAIPIGVARPSAATLQYAGADHRQAPIDWAGAVRQSVFAGGCAGVVAGVASMWATYFNEVGPLIAGAGALLVGLAVPWPGRFGRKR